MEHLIIDDEVVVAEKDLADQRKARFYFFTETAQALHEVVVEGVSYIEPESVDPKVLDPHLYTAEKIIDNSRIAEVQLHKLVVSLPSFIPETVVPAAVSVKINDEPVFVRGVPFFLLNVFECPESPSDMVEDAVQHDLYVVLVQCTAYFDKILVRSQTAVDLREISCVIAVIVRLKDRIEYDRADPELLEIFRPFPYLENAVGCDAVVVHRRAAESDRIYLIKSFVISPHNFSTFLFLISLHFLPFLKHGFEK